MISISETEVNEDALKKWTEQLPGCKIFLENFFWTCKGYEPEVNYLNYLRDLKLYSPTNRHIRENASDLVKPFYEITGTEAGELEEKIKLFLSGEADFSIDERT